MAARLAVQDLSAAYEMPGGGLRPALGPVTLNVETGSFVCLIGPSGCGKSTLIRIMAGLQQPTHGKVFLDGQAISQPIRRIGLMFQDANLMPWRTVTENIALPLELTGLPANEQRNRALELLPGLGLSSAFADSYPSELSGGMAQRVALGRVLIQRPDVLLLDEPFGALDALTRETITLDLMEMWDANHQTVLMVTHNIHEAILLADRILVFSRAPGQLIADIPVSLERPRRLDDTYNEAFGQVAHQVREALNQA